MGRRNRPRQAELWVATTDLPRSQGHIFYQTLNQLLAEAGFDAWLEALCAPYYAENRGRPAGWLGSDCRKENLVVERLSSAICPQS